MRNVIYFVLFALIVISCSKEDSDSNSRTCLDAEYNTNLEIELEDEICFPEGNSLILVDIEHAFCPCQALCDWEGGLYITLKTVINENTVEKKFYSNMLDQNKSIFDSYEISSFSYSYDSENGQPPVCIEDFDPEKTKLNFTISKL